MKQFLYLDTDIVNSIIAQNEQGLITGLSSDRENGESQTKGNSKSVEIEGSGSGKLFNIMKAEAALSGNGTFSSENSTHSVSHEVVSKTLHDASFDIALDYIKPVAMLDNPTCGSYMKLTKDFTFADTEYFEQAFSKDGSMAQMVKFLTNSSNASKEAKQTASTLQRQLNEAQRAVRLIKDLVPGNRMLLSNDGYVIPLEDKYFRVNPAAFGFKYGGKITCVGMITNVIQKNYQADDNIFATLQNKINDAFISFINAKSGKAYIVHPMAVYYEK